MSHSDSSPQEQGLAPVVTALVQRFAALWWAGESTLPALSPTYTLREQMAREAELNRVLKAVIAAPQTHPRTPAERGEARGQLMRAAEAFARRGLGWEDRHIQLFTSGGFVRAARDFAQAARRFDPQLSDDAIFQASRNAWTMYGLQRLLGLPVGLTPAILAYSLLYPYTDNYLDDPAIAAETKQAFDQNLGRRLAGETLAAQNTHERTIYTLVTMVEEQYPRAQYPQVAESLLAIHHAQEHSLDLLHRKAAPYEVDVLGISLEKGGTSVLADGYLVAGALTAAQQAFVFAWGAFLQLLDDLQDVQRDRRDGLLTIFSHPAGRWPLDGLTNRTLHFGLHVLQLLECFNDPGSAPLKELMGTSTLFLLLDAAGRAARFHSPEYISHLETYSPFRFAVLCRRRQELARQRISLLRLVESSAAAENGDVGAGTNHTI